MTTQSQLLTTSVDLSAESAATGGSTGLQAYTARTSGDDRLPGIVIVHEIFGVDDQARSFAHRLAEMGYLAVVPDLFTEGGPRRCLRATFSALRSGEGRAFRDIAAARQYLLGREDCTGGVGIIGFCMGGGFALLCAAPERGFTVSSANYGQLPEDPDVLRGACPIVASYGGRDRGLGGAAEKLDRKLTEFGVEHDVKEYPNASHAFLSTELSGPWYLRPVLKIAGMGPRPEAAADAWRRIEAFFAAHLPR